MSFEIDHVLVKVLFRELQARSARRRWEKIPPADRRRQMQQLAAKRWHKSNP